MSEAFLLNLALTLIAGTIVLRLVGLFTGGITFESWGAALAAVVITYLVGWAAAYAGMRLWSQTSPQDPTTVIATNAVIHTAVNFVSLAISASVISGIHVKGIVGLLVAAVALTAVELAIAYLPLALRLT